MAAKYTVQAGDSLSKISQKFYGDFSMVDELARLNNISNVNLIHPGQMLTIPDVQEAQVIESSELVSSTTDKSKWGKYVAWGFGILALVLLAYDPKSFIFHFLLLLVTTCFSKAFITASSIYFFTEVESTPLTLTDPENWGA